VIGRSARVFLVLYGGFKMKLVRHNFGDTEYTATEIDGVIYYSVSQLEEIFGVNYDDLVKMIRKSPDSLEYKSVKPSDVLTSLGLLNDPRVKILDMLGLIKRDNLTFMAEESVMSLAMIGKSDNCVKIRNELIEHIKKSATRTYVE